MIDAHPTTYVVERELYTATPRSVAYTGKTQAFRCFLFLLWIFAVGLVAYCGWHEITELSALTKSGTPAMARVVNMYTTSGKGGMRYHLVYEFQAEGATVRGNDSIPETYYEATRIGDPQRVTYLPGNPQVERAGEVTPERVEAAKPPFELALAVVFLAFGVLVVSSEYTIRTHRRLLQCGIPTVGDIVDREIVRGKSTTYYVIYQIEVVPGDPITKRVMVPRGFYDECLTAAPPTILYDPDNPESSYPYRAITEVRLTAG